MLELVKLDSATLPGIADAIRAKTGETALLLPSQMAEAIEGIQTGVTLPELQTPAAESDVLKGKEYIGEDAGKHTGSLVVCDTLAEVERFGENGIGLHLELESSADGSTTAIKLHEPNLMTDNIVVGASIFGVSGAAKTLRVETGTITPAEDTKSITIPCSDGAKAFILEATYDTISAIEGQSLIYAVAFAGTFISKHNIENAVNTAMTIWYKTQYASSGTEVQNSGGVTISLNYNFYPGPYRWAAYYWEDDA